MRRPLTFTCLLLLWACSSFSTTAASAQQPPSYTVTNLGTPLGGYFAAGSGVDPQGLIGGYANLPDNTEQHAMLFYRGQTKDLGTLGGANSAILSNFSGFSETADKDPDGQDFCEYGTFAVCRAVTVRNGSIVPLPLLSGRSSVAYGNNSLGQVVGVAATNIHDPNCAPGNSVSTFSEPVLWSEGAVQALPLPTSDSKGYALGINDHGMIVGATGVCTSNPYAHAVLWPGKNVVVLPGLGGLLFNAATSINNQDQIVGQSDLPGDSTAHAVLWSRGVVHDLGTLPGDVASYANAINNRGQVIGESCGDQGCRPVLWQNGEMYDLNALVPADTTLYLLLPVGIDDSGTITGYAFDPNTGTLPAFLASVHAQPTGAQGQLRQVPQVTLPASAQHLQAQLWSHRMTVRP